MADEGKAPPGKRSRAWCFTTNNYTSDDIAKTKAIECDYLIFGKEKGEEGTKHLQGYVYFSTLKSLRQLKKLLPRSHLEITRGSSLSNIRYCSKEDPAPFTKGTPPATAQDKGRIEKERWNKIYTLAKEDKLEDIPKKVLITHHSALTRIRDEARPTPDDLDHCTGIWIWGKSDTGKSTLAKKYAPNHYRKDLTKWWNFYDGEENVYIDDMDPFHKSLGKQFKDWLGQDYFLAEVKNGYRKIRPKLVVVTSQYPPEGIWDDEETLAAIRRRCEIYHLTEPQGGERKKRPLSVFASVPALKKHKPIPPRQIILSHDCDQH